MINASVKCTLVLLILTIVYSGCRLAGSRSPATTCERRFIPYTAISLADSLEVNAELNDSVFATRKLSTTRISSMTSRVLPLESLIVTYSVRNRSSGPLLVSSTHRCPNSCSPGSTDGLCLEVGTEHGVVPMYDISCLLSTRRPDSIYRTLDGYGTLSYSEPVQLTELLANPSLDTGIYWVRLAYKNFLWLDTLPIVWVGEIWSDTLWFRVAD